MKMECCSVLVVSLLFHRNIPSSLWPPCFGLWGVCSVDDTKGGDWAGRVKERVLSFGRHNIGVVPLRILILDDVVGLVGASRLKCRRAWKIRYRLF